MAVHIATFHSCLWRFVVGTELVVLDHCAVQEQLVQEGKRMLAAFALAVRGMSAYVQYAGALDTAIVAIYADISNSKVPSGIPVLWHVKLCIHPRS